MNLRAVPVVFSSKTPETAAPDPPRNLLPVNEDVLELVGSFYSHRRHRSRTFSRRVTLCLFGPVFATTQANYDFVFEKKLIEAIERELEAAEEARKKQQAAKRAREESDRTTSNGPETLAGSDSSVFLSASELKIDSLNVDFGSLDGVNGPKRESPSPDRSLPSKEAETLHPASLTPMMEPPADGTGQLSKS